jgi:hypothetical protein
VTDEGCREQAFVLGQRPQQVGERAQVACHSLGAAVPRQIGDEHPVPPRQQRRELDPVRGRAAEAVKQNDGRAFPADLVAEQDTVDHC